MIKYFTLFFTGIIFISLYAYIGIFLIQKNFVFDGKFFVSYDFEDASPFISELKPRGRINQEFQKDEFNNSYQELYADPVYFDLSLPRSFTEADVTLRYKNKSESLLELGLFSKEKPENLHLQPVEHGLLEKIKNEGKWSVLSHENVVLLQKEQNYNSVNDFLNNLPNTSTIAQYNYDVQWEYFEDNYQPLNEYNTQIHKSLRGSHEFLTYIGENETIDFIFNINDVNRIDGEDDIQFNVLDNSDNIVFSYEIKDDGITDNSSVFGTPFDYNLVYKPKKHGVYKVQIISSDDMMIRSILTKQKYITFVNSVYLADNVGYLNDKFPSRYDGTTLITNTEKVSAITSHIEGFQNIEFGNQSVEIDQRHIMYTVSNLQSERNTYLEKVFIPQNDVKIIGKGYFAFNQEQFFAPDIRTIPSDEKFIPENFGIDYIIAGYQFSQITDSGWTEKTISFDLTKVENNDNEYRFIFSFPVDDSKKSELFIENISMSIYGEPIDYKNFIEKVINGILK